MRGVSDVVAAVILVAVTVAVAVGVVGYVTGVFGSAAGGAEQLLIMPDSYIDLSDVNLTGWPSIGLHLHVANKGGTDIYVEYIYVSGSGDKVTRFYLLDHDAGLRQAYQDAHGIVTAIIPAGFNGWVIAQIRGQGLVAGGHYTVKVYTRNGNVFVATIVAKR